MLFRKDNDKMCACCKNAGLASNGKLLCPRKGFVRAEDCCRHYRYDPLKRIPKRAKVKDFSGFGEDDFSL